MSKGTLRRVPRRHVLVGAGGALVACGPAGGSAAGGAGGGAAGAKKEYVVSPPLGTVGQLAATISRATPLAEFLAKESGVPLKAFAPTDYAGTMIGLREGTIDFGFLPAVLFLRAQDESGVRPLFRTTRPGPDDRPTPAFTSIIAVRADSGISSIADLKGKRIVAIDVSDAAGWVLPAAHVKKSGVDPDKDAKVEYRKDGPDALLQVLNKKADAAFAARKDLQAASVLKADPEAAMTLNILATIDNAPLEVVAHRRALDAKVVDKVRAAFRSLGDPQKATVAGKDGTRESILGQWGISGLVETKDADFAALREAGKSIGIKLK